MKKIASTFILALLFCTQANAQFGLDTLRVLYASEPGVRPARIFSDGFESGNTSLLDFNGDGKPDLILTSEDDDGNLKDILVIDLALRPDTLWEVRGVQQTLGFQDITETVGVGFFGFADPDGDGEREAIFANGEDVVLINPSDNSLSFQTVGVLVGVTDLTDDGYEELIIFLPQIKQLLVWSKP